MDAIGEAEDPLDRGDFDAVAYINQHFPTESSLKRLDPFVSRVNTNITALDEEISRAVHAQAEAGERAAKDISEAKAAIHDLHTKIKDIKGKAEQSELMVQEICKDIRQLDYAKRHLQTTITALKRLHMLVTAVDQLQIMAKEKHYREAANLLEAVSQLLLHFLPYANIARIKELQATVTSVKTTLTEEILEAFTRCGALARSVADPGEFANSEAGAGDFATLSEACLVVDALGPEAVTRQVTAIVNDQLSAYSTMPEFKRGGDAASLDQIERRFSWFRRMLKEVETRFAKTFPAQWLVPHRLCVEFMTTTKAGLLLVLNSGDDEVKNVTVLLKALQKSLLFEKDMAAKFEANESMDGTNAAQGGSNGSVAELSNAELPKLVALLSSVFDPFMGPYIALERKNLEEMMLKYIEEEQVGQDGALPVYTSSVQMFGYIKGSVKRCTALTAGQTFFNLQKEFKACLSQYCQILRQKHSTEVGPAGSKQGGAAPDLKFEMEVCYVVNTGEYCADTISQLEELIKAKIDGAYADKVELSGVQDQFYDVIAGAIRTLVTTLEGQVEGALKAMGNINWGSVEMVGEESPYVRAINQAVLAFVPNCRSILSSLYFRNFCDKFAAAFCPAFLTLIQKQRRISEEGTQQLLLDVYNLKKMMLELPRVGREPDAADVSVPMSYRKYVEKHMSKVERLLKLVATPVEMLVEHFRMMWPEGGNKELQVVMALKGMKRSEQITVLETFGGSGGGRPGTEGVGGAEGVGGDESDLKARAMKGMKGAMDDFQKISTGMKTAFR